MKIINEKPSQWDYTEIIFEADFEGNPFMSLLKKGKKLN